MSPRCAACDGDGGRRDFIRQVATILAGLPIIFDTGRATASEEAAYPIPTEDGATIDKPREVILVRYEKAVYAFGLSCPHQKTPLRWKPETSQFQCPKHKSRFQPDGSFIDGRATRNMDRYAIRREGDEVRVSLDKLYREDENREEWVAALVTL